MMRITSGSAKNTNLIAPDLPKFRAAQDVVKQAIFSIVGDKVINAVCLDLFAGSGSFGLEALSRGAASCDFIDSTYEATQATIQNIKKCHFEDRAEVFLKDAGKFLQNIASDKYDLIFIDPFYDDVKHKHLFKNLSEFLKADGIVVFSHGDNLKLEDVLDTNIWKSIDERKFGSAVISFLSL